MSVLDKYLLPEELAVRWKRKRGDLTQWRRKGKGPRFERRGRFVLYSITVVERFEKEHRAFIEHRTPGRPSKTRI